VSLWLKVTKNGGMKPLSAFDTDWPLLLTLLPADLEASAKETGALRRKRGVPSAPALLRLAFAFAYVGLSLRAVATWARQTGVACLSDVALLQRLRRAAPWAGRLLAQQLAQQAALQRHRLPTELTVRLIDATTASRPGSQGTDFRVHLRFDLGTLTITDVTVTDAQGGESFQQHALLAGEIAVGDRGYAHRRGMAAAHATGARLIVRLNWQNVPLQRRDGTAFALLEHLRSLGAGEIGEWAVQTAPAKDGTPAVPGRLVAVRKSPPAAEKSRRKLLAAARKQGKTPDARTLEAAEYVFVFTTVPAERLTALAVLELYRFRWQIELAFKRLKGVLALDELTAKDPALCRLFLCIKLLGALLVEQLSHRWVDFSPWGYGPPAAVVTGPPVSGGGGDRRPGGGSGADPGAMGSRRRGVGSRVPRHPAPAPQPSHRSHLVC
jgi:Transposase DDE domain